MKASLCLVITCLLLAGSHTDAATLYVSQASSNPTPPYDSWATAATKIQDAVAAAPQGAMVLVTNGVYAGEVSVGKPLTLLSVNGAQFTLIDGGSNNPCVSLADGVSLSGFTLTNGSAINGGGALCNSTNAYLTNCLLVGSSATQWGGGAYQGTLYNCLLIGNSAGNAGAGSFNSTLINCLLSSNTLGAAFGGTLYNCTVVANSGGQWGVVSVAEATVYNSIIYYNSSWNGANHDASHLNYCCTSPMPTNGVGNITNAPLFVDAPRGNFRLQAGSPCIDAGDNAFVNSTTDLDGNPRISSGTVDLGVYEFQSSGPPAISQQPADQTVYAGSSVSFGVGVAGSSPFSWQWQFNGTSIAGATGAKLLLSSVTTNQAGGYSVVVTNSMGSITSQVAVLNILDVAPSITLQPLNQTVYAGTNVTFTAGASGSLPLHWQWEFNGVAIQNATDSSLALQEVKTNQAGGYSAIVTNALGSATSQVAVLTVMPVSVTVQPLSQTVYAGGTVTFTASATGSLPLFFQWWFNGTAIQGATNSTLTIPVVTTSSAGSYSVVASNAFGSATTNAVLNVLTHGGIYYVSQNSLSPTPPYTNWATAARTIQDAIDIALAGDQIVVTNGLYATGGRLVGGSSVTNRLGVDKPLTIRSVNGPAVTFIQGDQAIGCVYLAGGALLSGFTLTGGATSFGGGAYCASTNAVLTNCVLVGNSASGTGGGAIGGTLINCVLGGNSASFGGGAAGSMLVNCTLSTNSARMGGGAYQANLQYCTLSNNSAFAEGGGVAESFLNNCILTGNSGDTGGGAYYSTLDNCVLSGNSATQGGGANQGTFINCTLTGNSANKEGGGAEGASLTNCIVFFNTAPTGPNYYAGCAFGYSCTTPLPPGPGNIAADPLLASTSHLSAQSPCIGRGSAAYTSGTDIDGDAWQNPPCMGADQVIPGQNTGPITVGVVVANTNVSIGFVLPVQVQINGRLTASAWDFGDGTVVSNAPYATHAWAAPGDYVVRLTGYNDPDPSGLSGTITVHVALPEVYYVNAASSAPLFPYTSQANAAKTIQEAIDAGTQMGRVVVVADGVYGTGGRAVYGLMTNRVVLTEGVEVQSVNGPAATIISGTPSALGGNNDGAIRCAYVGANAVLSGFTLSNGYTRAVSFSTFESSGGGAWCEVSGVVTNCTLSGNAASYRGGGAYGGTLNNCLVSSNNAGWGGGTSGSALNNCSLIFNSANQGGGCEGSTLSFCVLTGNSASQGGGTEGGTLNNCSVYSNSATLYGGGVFEAIVNNSTLTANSASQGGGAASATGSSVLNNCTLTGNFASDSGGGAYSGVLNNCIVYYNLAPNGSNYSGGSTFAYSCTTPLPPGIANFQDEPLLASATHLSQQSLCIGRGSSAYASGVDIDGEAWQNPPCIGADQFVSGQTIGPLSVSISAGYTNVGTGFAVPLQALIQGQLAASVWDFGDGLAVSNHPYLSHAWTTPGQYVVTLTAYSDSHPSGLSATLQVLVVAAQVYYVNASNASPLPPYSSWAAAATNIQDAIDAGTQKGRLVLVADGVYNSGNRLLGGIGTNRVVVPEGVEVRSVGGPASALIVGDDATRCAYVGTNALLNGFTLTNGHAFANSFTANGGGAWCEVSGAVTNCILSGNSTANNGGGIFGGTAYNCILSSNRAGIYGGAASGGTLNHCALNFNSASSGGGAYDATLNYCTLSTNTGYSYGGGGAFQSSLNNCTLAGNSSGGGGGAYGGTLTSCTLSGNQGYYAGSGVLYATLYNSIIFYNRGSPDCSGCTLAFCCTPLPTAGTGNITNEPLFINAAAGNLRLQSASPCINAGNNAYVSGTNDLDGNPRIVGGTVDMGAYEFQGSGSIIPYFWLQRYGLPTDGSADFIDSDGDGMNNWQEWICGTDPTNPLSVLRLLSATPSGANVAVTWQSVPGINYFLERSADIAASFTIAPTNTVVGRSNIVAPANISLVATNILGQGSNTTSYTDTNVGGAGPFFYRVGVRSQ